MWCGRVRLATRTSSAELDHSLWRIGISSLYRSPVRFDTNGPCDRLVSVSTSWPRSPGPAVSRGGGPGPGRAMTAPLEHRSFTRAAGMIGLAGCRHVRAKAREVRAGVLSAVGDFPAPV